MSVMLWNRTSRNPIASLRRPGAAVGATASAIVKHLAIRPRFLAAAGTLLRVSAVCTSQPATRPRPVATVRARTTGPIDRIHQIGEPPRGWSDGTSPASPRHYSRLGRKRLADPTMVKISYTTGRDVTGERLKQALPH